ncbi:hypothetical protein N806_30805 [Rhodococcus sp. P27]|nr:hypothetical protein N806_30805 [Rhodococcus sp. P27]
MIGQSLRVVLLLAAIGVGRGFVTRELQCAPEWFVFRLGKQCLRKQGFGKQ